MKVASKQRNRRNRKLARKKKSDPHQAKSRLRKMRRTRSAASSSRVKIIFDGQLRSAAHLFVMRHERMEREKRQRIGYVALVVRDYDEAIEFYTNALGLNLSRTPHSTTKSIRVLLAAPGSVETRLLLAKASTPQQAKRIGDQTAVPVFLFLHTEDFWRAYRQMSRTASGFRGSSRRIVRHRRTVENLYGNRWDLLQLRSSATGFRAQVSMHHRIASSLRISGPPGPSSPA